MKQRRDRNGGYQLQAMPRLGGFRRRYVCAKAGGSTARNFERLEDVKFTIDLGHSTKH